MSYLKKLKELVGDEAYKKVKADLGDKDLIINNGTDFIPKAKFNEVNETKKSLETQLADVNKKLKELEPQIKENETLKKQVEDIRTSSEEAKTELEDKLKKQAFDFKLETALKGAGAKNVKSVKALLNSENIKLDGETLIGLDDQLKTLKESDGYLFGEIKVSGPGHKEGDPPTFFTQEQVAGMSQADVLKNMEAIDKSREKW